MGKSALIAETGAGQHGVATAAAAARLGLRCTVYMGAEDAERQAANVRRMKLLGAQVLAIESGSRTLKDAINAALRAWISEQHDTHYCFGTAAGPYPFPDLVREFQSVIGREARAQMLEQTGALPDYVVAAVGGGSNAIGMFAPFVADEGVELIGVEAGGTGEASCQHSAAINLGRPGVLHGEYTMLLQDDDGQIMPSSSISAGLDYPGVGPEHAYLHKIGRVKYGIAYDHEALAAFQKLCRTEGILPALESSHALAYVLEHREEFAPGSRVLVNLSGRGDKDMDIIERALG
jgi:tryptophan synthase beta chain